MMTTDLFLKKFKILDKIGEGSFSEVLKCRNNLTGECFAAKKLKKRFDRLEDVFNCAEIIAMQKIRRHSQILCMLEYFYDNTTRSAIFLFELMDMSLFDYIKMRTRYVTETRAKCYLYQIINGIHYLHTNGLFHRDIKPENILLKIPKDIEAVEILKIADLGSIRGIFSRPPYTEYISTRWYRSPECLLTSGYYGPKMDVWAAGCVFYEILALKPLFPGENELDQLAKIHAVLGTPTTRFVTKYKFHKSFNFTAFPKQVGLGITQVLTSLSTEGRDIMKLMICYDPDIRSNSRRLIENKYFLNIRDKIERLLIEYSSNKQFKNFHNLALPNTNLRKIPYQKNNKYANYDHRMSSSTSYVTANNLPSASKAVMTNATLPDIRTFGESMKLYPFKTKQSKPEPKKDYSNMYKDAKIKRQPSQIPVLNKAKSMTISGDRRTITNKLNERKACPKLNTISNSFVLSRINRLDPIPEVSAKLLSMGFPKQVKFIPAKKNSNCH